MGRNPPEGRDRNGVPYGGIPVSDPRCRSLDGRDLPVWIAGERMGYAFGVEAGPGEFLFVARCTGDTEDIISAGGVQSPSIELHFRCFDRVVMMTASEAAYQLARSVTPLQSVTGIRSAGFIMVTDEDEGCSLNREYYSTKLPDVVTGVHTSRPAQVPQGDEVAARQQEFLSDTDSGRSGRDAVSTMYLY